MAKKIGFAALSKEARAKMARKGGLANAKKVKAASKKTPAKKSK